MEISDSPTSDWAKDKEYENWFEDFNDLDDADGFEVIENPGDIEAGGDEE